MQPLLPCAIQSFPQKRHTDLDRKTVMALHMLGKTSPCGPGKYSMAAAAQLRHSTAVRHNILSQPQDLLLALHLAWSFTSLLLPFTVQRAPGNKNHMRELGTTYLSTRRSVAHSTHRSDPSTRKGERRRSNERTTHDKTHNAAKVKCTCSLYPACNHRTPAQ